MSSTCGCLPIFSCCRARSTSCDLDGCGEPLFDPASESINHEADKSLSLDPASETGSSVSTVCESTNCKTKTLEIQIDRLDGGDLTFRSEPEEDEQKFTNVRDEDLTDLQKLEKHCPLATDEERLRFFNAKDGNYDLALEQLEGYLAWRKQYDLDTQIILPPSEPVTSMVDDDFLSCASSEETLDEIDWRCASEKALSYNLGEGSRGDCSSTSLPQLVRILTEPGSDEHSKDNDGNRILHMLPAQMNPDIADDTDFALSIAFYLERKMNRSSLEKMTVVIDVRGGHGWANPKPGALIPFIRKISSIMERNFPERLAKSVIFPMPRTAAVLWKIIKVFLDPNTVSKIAVVAGRAATDSEPPFKGMEEHLSREVISHMEMIRLESFVPSA